MSTFINNTSDAARYEKEWLPKVVAYRERLDKSIIKEYLAPKNLVPESLDIQFNATEVPYKVLSKKDIEITDSSAVKLVDEMSSGKLTAVEVLTSFIKRATLAHQLTHCAMEFLTEDALARAEELDEILAKTGKTVGPLHGLPISLKEHIALKDRITHGSFVGNLDNVSTDDALTAKVLKQAGAILYIRTSEPQTLMHEDSTNNITGRTANPYNTSLSSGGSSSGEGACVGMGGSPIGVGTDVGGSIRAPAAFSGGIFGFRPTCKRLSMKGCLCAGSGQQTVDWSIGPLCKNIEDVNLFMKAYLDMKPWEDDTSVIPMPWRNVETSLEGLTIGILYDDDIVRPHPPIERGLKHVNDKLNAAGVKTVKFIPYKSEEIWIQTLQAYASDGNLGQKSNLKKSGEPVVKLSEWALSMNPTSEFVTVPELYDINTKRDQLRDYYLSIMQREGIDYIISPVYAGVAPVPDTLKYWNYCSMFNYLDMPSVVFPTGLFQDPSVDVKDESYETRNKYEEYEYGLYEADKFKGAAISLQIVGKRYFDEEVVSICEKISKII